jgi:hypothetical protein
MLAHLGDDAQEGPDCGQRILDPEDGGHLSAELHLVARVANLTLQKYTSGYPEISGLGMWWLSGDVVAQ